MDKRTPSSRLEGWYERSGGTPADRTPLQKGFHGTPELAESRLKQDFFLKQHYKNSLPDIPCEPKHQAAPLKLCIFEPPTSELKQFYDQLPDWDYGVDVDLVGYYYKWTQRDEKENKELNPVDMELLKDDVVKAKNEKRTSVHSKNVTWLRRTEYISSEGARFKTKQSDKAEFRVGEPISRRLKLEPSKFNCFKELNDRKVRMKWIEKSFEVVSNINMDIRHPSNPKIVPVEILPVFPDFELWKHSEKQQRRYYI